MKSRKDKERLTPEELEEFMALQSELDELKAQRGEGRPEGRVSRAISGFFDYRENREKQVLNKKKYILLAVFTGWMGGHRFYAKQWPTAILYLLFFWCGFPLAMTIVDLMIVIPMQANENGNILL